MLVCSKEIFSTHIRLKLFISCFMYSVKEDDNIDYVISLTIIMFIQRLMTYV